MLFYYRVFDKYKFSIVIPIHNEELILKKQIYKLLFALKKSFGGKNEWEILLVENGSSDSTLKLARDLKGENNKIALIEIKDAGYGLAIRLGIKNAHFPHIVIFNIDYWSVDFLKEALVLFRSEENLGAVVGSKRLRGSKDRRPWDRKLITFLFNNFILKGFLGYSGSDTHGIKVLKKKNFGRLLDLCYSKYFLFDTELLLKFKKRGGKLIELPTRVREIRRSSLGFFERLKITFKDLAYILLRKRTSVYFTNIKTVDDFGFDLATDKKVINWFKNKLVDRVAVVVNTKNSKKSLLLAKEARIPVVLHFNIINGRPISSSDKVPSLINKKGSFLGLKFFWRLILGKIKFSDIEKELRVQKEVIEKLGIRLSGFNSHYNIHLFHPIWCVCTKHFSPLGMRSWRATKNNLWKTAKLRLLAFYFLGLLVKIIKDKGEESNEKIIHPFWFENKGSFTEIWRILDKTGQRVFC